VLLERGPILAHLEKDHLDYRTFRLMDEVQYDLEGKRFVENRLRKKFGARLQVQRVQPNLHMLWGLQACRGYEEGLLPPLNYRTFMGYDLANRRMGRFTRNLHGVAPDTVLLGLLNVKYVLTDKPVVGNRLKFVTKMLFRPNNFREEEIFKELPERFLHFALYENLDYLPKFLWGDRLRAVCDLERLDVNPSPAGSMLSMDERGMNLTYRRVDENSGETLLSTATLASDTVVSTASLWSQVVKDQALTIQRPEGDPNAFFVEKSDGEAGEILFLEAPYPGWVCRWEGGEAPLERVNAIMMGCQVPPEAGSLEIIYEPFSFRLGLFLSCCFVLLLSTVVCFLQYPAQRRVATEG
jgi:hypothetical protein